MELKWSLLVKVEVLKCLHFQFPALWFVTNSSSRKTMNASRDLLIIIPIFKYAKSKIVFLVIFVLPYGVRTFRLGIRIMPSVIS